MRRPGEARALFGGIRTSAGMQDPIVASYDVADDGERFLVMRAAPAPKRPITVVTDWQSGLQQ
jgi:hypothetical protein